MKLAIALLSVVFTLTTYAQTNEPPAFNSLTNARAGIVTLQKQVDGLYAALAQSYNNYYQFRALAAARRAKRQPDTVEQATMIRLRTMNNQQSQVIARLEAQIKTIRLNIGEPIPANSMNKNALTVGYIAPQRAEPRGEKIFEVEPYRTRRQRNGAF